MTQKSVVKKTLRKDFGFYSDDELAEGFGLAKVTIWRLRQRGEFPAKVKLSPNRGGTPVGKAHEWENDPSGWGKKRNQVEVV